MRLFMICFLGILSLSTGQAVAASGPWFVGSVEQAFLKAKKDHKPIFLYWGAAWCPPCNELKAQVFTQPRFQELMQQAIAVSLDGDSEEAQTWGAKLRADGYPTLLLLSPAGEEMLRLSNALTMFEFEQAFTAAVLFGAPIAKVLTTMEKGQLAPAAWKALARAEWEESSGGKPWTRQDLLRIKWQLFQRVPRSLEAEKGLFASQLLLFASQLSDEEVLGLPADARKLYARIASHPQELLAAFLAKKDAILAARSMISGQASLVLRWARPALSPQQLQATALAWIQAAETIRRDQSVSVDNRLWAIYPSLDIYRFLKGQEAPLPLPMVKAVQAAVALADHTAKTPYQRQAVISGAAYLLQQVHDPKGAEHLLGRELSRTTAPWFYQLKLAHLEADRGHTEAALKWSLAAKNSVRGLASRLQWMSQHLQFIVKLTPTDHNALVAGTKEFYELIFSLKDGFEGRNGRQARQLVKVLKPVVYHNPKLAETLRPWRSQCQNLISAARGACNQHFADLLSASDDGLCSEKRGKKAGRKAPALAS